jgi:hypothetical protein
MKNAIAAGLTAFCLLVLAGCDIQAEPAAARLLRYQVDPGRDRSWWLTRDGVLLHSAAQPKKFIALPGWIWADEPHCPPGIAIGPNGEAVVTSNAVSMIWRIDPQTLAVSVHELDLGKDAGRDVGFVALAYSAEQAGYFAYSANQPAVWKIDRHLARASRVADVDFGRMRSPRVPSPRGACAQLEQQLNQFAGIGG